MRSVERRGPPPKPIVYFDSNRDTSLVTHAIVARVLSNWQDEIVRQTLATGHVPIEVTQPFVVQPQDVSAAEPRRALWSKLLPLVMFVWALTGAFYPAVDLCAGEKERGTLETLLTSPAGRSNIVGGKLLTVMTFSAMSALCNMGTLALTARMMSGTLQSLDLPLDPPGGGAIAWLLVGLLPMCTLFSAASLALAALARSTKEGQYYLMPLLLVSMPLLLLPLMPGIELNLSTSLLPVTGLMLVLRAAMEGQLDLAATYLLPMGLVTAACCAMAIRWAIYQFNQEEVLFRDTENFDLRSWLRHTYRNRGEVGGLGSALLCILAIYQMQFLVQNLVSGNLAFARPTFESLARLVVVMQLGCILLPAVLFAWFAAKRPLQALRISFPRPSRPGLLAVQILLAVLLAFAIHPLGVVMGEVLGRYFPLPEEVANYFNQVSQQGSIELWKILLLLAVLPAVVEELAFRGFILSGLRTRLSATGAVLISAAAFGFAHSLSAQQTISAAVLGIVLGILALKTQHISPCIGFHLGYNGVNLLRVAYSEELRELADRQPLLRWFFEPGGETGVGYTPMMVIVAGALSLALLLIVWRLGRPGAPSALRPWPAGSEELSYATHPPAEESRA